MEGGTSGLASYRQGCTSMRLMMLHCFHAVRVMSLSWQAHHRHLYTCLTSLRYTRGQLIIIIASLADQDHHFIVESVVLFQSVLKVLVGFSQC